MLFMGQDTNESVEPESDETGLPWLHSWNRVYLVGDHPLRNLDRFAGRVDAFLFMSALDFVVLIGSMLGIAAYGIWRTRGRRELNTYLKGDSKTAWFAIGLSVMATQASAITFLSTPWAGLPRTDLDLCKFILECPIALIIIAAVFLPIFRRLNVYTAYEFLGRRFDTKTRLLGAALFLVQRGSGRRADDLRALHRARDCLWLAAEFDDYQQRIGGYCLYRDGRQWRCDRHAKISTRHHLRGHGHCILPGGGEIARRAHLYRHLCPGGRISEAQRGEFFNQCASSAIHFGRACSAEHS